MPIFDDGKEIEYTFTTPSGKVATLAMVHIDGSTLELSGVLVYPFYGNRLNIGLRNMLAITRTIQELAKLEGFMRLLVVANRTSGATPGREVWLDRRLK